MEKQKSGVTQFHLKGELINITVHVERQLYMQLKIALAVDELTLSGWFRGQAHAYVQARLKNVDMRALLSEWIRRC